MIVEVEEDEDRGGDAGVVRERETAEGRWRQYGAIREIEMLLWRKWSQGRVRKKKRKKTKRRSKRSGDKVTKKWGEGGEEKGRGNV